MNLLLTEIINIINNGNKINDNIVGINYLEKIKYLIINNFKENQDKFIIDNLISELKKQNSQSKKLEFKNQSLTLTVNLYKDSLSKINSCYTNDTLFIVIDGIKVISLLDVLDKKKKIPLTISKNMGLVLSKNTITSENIATNSIIMDIVSEKKIWILKNDIVNIEKWYLDIILYKMIVYNLICKICSSKFEGWFENAKEFDIQKRKKIVNCPYCNSNSIKKFLMAPNLSTKSNSKKETKLKKAVANNIKKYKKIVEKNFDYVGDKFTEEAKKMKYGEKEERPIYGEATIEQTKELAEEEINVVPLPWAPTKKTN